MEPREFHWPMSAIFSFFVSFIGPGYDAIAQHMDINDESRELLDVGGGSGMFALSLARLYPNLTRIVSSDIAPAMVNRAVNNAKRAGLSDRIEGEVQDVHKMSFSDGEFDCVVSTGSMHHWLRPGDALREIDRVLRPGGKIIIFDFFGRPSIFNIRRDLARQANEYVKSLPGSLPFIPGTRLLLYFLSWHIAPFFWLGSKDVLFMPEIERAVEESGLSYLSILTEDITIFVSGTKP